MRVSVLLLCLVICFGFYGLLVEGKAVAALYYFSSSDCSSSPIFVSMRHDIPTPRSISNSSENCWENVICAGNPNDPACRSNQVVMFSSLLNDTSMATFVSVQNGTMKVKPFHFCSPSKSYRNCYVVHIPIADIPAPTIISPQAPAETIVIASLVVAAIGLIITAIVIFVVWKTRQTQTEYLGSASDDVSSGMIREQEKEEEEIQDQLHLE